MKTLKFTLIVLLGIISISAFADDKNNIEAPKAKAISMPEPAWGTPAEAEELAVLTEIKTIQLPDFVWGSPEEFTAQKTDLAIELPAMQWGTATEVEELLTII